MKLIVKPLGILVVAAAILGLGTMAFLAQRQLLSKVVVDAPGSDTTFVIPEGAEVTGIPIIAAGSSRWSPVEVKPAKGTVETVTVPDGPQTAAGPIRSVLRITTITPVPQDIWSIQARRTIPILLPKGRRFALRFWARSPERGVVHAVIEQDREPYVNELSRLFNPTPEWKQYTFPVRFQRSYDAGKAALCMQVGRDAGVYEFSQVELIDLDSAKAQGGTR